MNTPSVPGAGPLIAADTGGDDARSSARPMETRSARSVDPPALLTSLRQLMHLGSVAVAGQASAGCIALILGVELRVVPIVTVIGALVVMNVLTAARLKRGTPTTHYETAGHLALDLVAFSVLLLLTGGTANPFGLLYL